MKYIKYAGICEIIRVIRWEDNPCKIYYMINFSSKGLKFTFSHGSPESRYLKEEKL